MDLGSPITDNVSPGTDCCKKHIDYLRALKKKLNQLNGMFETVAENTSLVVTKELPDEHPPLLVTQKLPETSLIVSLKSVFDRAWNFLGEDSVGIMGLYGMGGVGKTTLLKNIHNQVNKGGSVFDIVIWVVISKEVNMGRVQEEIGKKLGLSLPDSNNISNVLRRKKFMLLLDDIWEQIDLSTIGVPSPSLQNKSKIVFTTRSDAVCRHMLAHKIIRVECLNWEAAWTLFQEKVGYTTLSSDSDIPRLAKIVANECRGLPLALITIGRSMASKKTRHEWEHAIKVLKNSAAKGMGDNVLPLLKFSYDSLPNDSVKLSFLFCSLYPENCTISKPNLIEQWIGEGYINGYDNFKEALNIGNAIIGILKDVCLLEEASMKCGNKGVKMHDVIQDLALWIACECGREKSKYIVQAPQVWKSPTMTKKISLRAAQLENIPRCENLTTLLVFYAKTLKPIDNNFFLSMPVLRFLDLSYTEIDQLPTSICKLVELEFLDLTSTNITSLHSEMRNLTKLKHLSLRNITRCRIPDGIIRNLSNLENLKLDIRKDGRFDMDELLCFKQLKSLEIRIDSDSKVVEKFLSYPKLATCARKLCILTCNDVPSLSLSASSSSSSSSDLCLGHLKELQYLNIEKCSKIKELKLTCINKSRQIGGLYESLEVMALDNLPRLVISWDARYLYCAHFRILRSVIITNCNAMVNLTWLLFIPKLQTLWIETCNSLQEIISSSDESGEAYDRNIFSNLKVLSLNELHNLRSICSMTALPFPSLETLIVRKCRKLRMLPLDSNSANNTLEEIDAEKEWWDRLEWENETIKTHFANYFKRSL